MIRIVSHVGTLVLLVQEEEVINVKLVELNLNSSNLLIKVQEFVKTLE